MGPIWGRQDPGGPHVGPMNLAIWGDVTTWKCFPHYWPLEGFHWWILLIKDQWCRALVLSLLLVWTSCWKKQNNRVASDLGCHNTHVMSLWCLAWVEKSKIASSHQQCIPNGIWYIFVIVAWWWYEGCVVFLMQPIVMIWLRHYTRYDSWAGSERIVWFCGSRILFNYPCMGNPITIYIEKVQTTFMNNRSV